MKFCVECDEPCHKNAYVCGSKCAINYNKRLDDEERRAKKYSSGQLLTLKHAKELDKEYHFW